MQMETADSPDSADSADMVSRAQFVSRNTLGTQKPRSLGTSEALREDTPSGKVGATREGSEEVSLCLCTEYTGRVCENWS